MASTSSKRSSSSPSKESTSPKKQKMDLRKEILLQVGESCFHVGQDTFNKLKGKFEEEVCSTEENKYFIDRDGELFKYILRYLRSDIISFPDDFKDGDMLMKEAEYYGLTDLEEHFDKGAGKLEIVTLLVMTPKEDTSEPKQPPGEIWISAAFQKQPEIPGIDILISWTSGKSTNQSITWKTLFESFLDKRNFTVHKCKNTEIYDTNTIQVQQNNEELTRELEYNDFLNIGSAKNPYLFNVKDETIIFSFICGFLNSGFSLVTDESSDDVTYFKKPYKVLRELRFKRIKPVC